MKVSIVTVCYNSEKTIKKTIESVLNQTYNNIEYIIVDGNSTDNTVEIIRSYEKKFKRKEISYKWTSEPDKGIYDAMNKGIKMSTGEIIGIINSDDWYEKNALSIIEEKFKEEYDIYFGDIFFMKKNQKILRKSNENLRKLREGMSIKHPSCFVKNQTYKELGGYNTNYKISGDYDFILRCYKSNKIFYYIPTVLACMSDGGISNKYVLESWKEVRKSAIKNKEKLLLAYYFYYLKLVKRIVLKIIK